MMVQACPGSLFSCLKRLRNSGFSGKKKHRCCGKKEPHFKPGKPEMLNKKKAGIFFKIRPFCIKDICYNNSNHPLKELLNAWSLPL